jgi:hypothetical protein
LLFLEEPNSIEIDKKTTKNNKLKVGKKWGEIENLIQ